MLDTISDILTRLTLKGTLYFRTSFTPPWGVAVPAYENVARFHYAHKGDCRVRVHGTGRDVLLAQGDLIIIPHGAAHDLISPRDGHDDILPLDEVLQRSGYTGDGVLVYSGSDQDDHDTQLICGHFSLAPQARHLIFDQLPPFIRIANYGETAGRWMEASLRLIGDETGHAKYGGDLIALKMSEVIFVQAIRNFIETDGKDHVGLAGFADPRLARALTAFHKDPALNWSVESLAREAGLSRTGFAVHFAQKMGLTPMQYLTSWRMQIACQELAAHGRSVAEVAAQVGYMSDSAFSRVFKREIGQTPAAFRTSA